MRTLSEATGTSLRVIELAGAPGAGKTSLLPAVADACRAVGLRPYTVTGAARPFAGRTLPGRLSAGLPTTVRRRVLWAIFYWASVLNGLELLRRHHRLVTLVVRSQRARPRDADARRRRVLYWFFRTAGAHLFLQRYGRPDEVLILDEGYVHRTVQLHTSAAEQPDRARVADYVAELPPVDLLIVVEAPVDVCQRRVRRRGVWQRLAHRSFDEVDRFVANAHAAVELAAAGARTRGRAVVTVDNGGTLASAEAGARTSVAEALGGTRRPSADRWTVPLLRVPRLGWLRAQRRLDRRPDDVDAWTGVVRRYGIDPTGHPVVLAMGRRNENVKLDTTDGAVVVRRYRNMAPDSSVAFEHEVLMALERHGFPSVRLRRTADGHTAVARDDRTYAVFDFVSGHTIGAWIVLDGRARAQLHETAGRMLARMHDTLDGLRPEAVHHLGFSPVTGRRSIDATWLLETIDALRARTADGPPEAVEHHRVLAAMADDLGAQLVELDAAVNHADLPRTVIHGDYGVHNLIIRHDGTAVVTDFELARRELRLIDLIIVLSRTPCRDAASFLAGYRDETTVPAAEWRELTNVWRYYRLAGAVQSWSNYFGHGDIERLRTARKRIDEAAWAETEVARRWG